MYAEFVEAPLDAALQHILDAQFLADFLEGYVFVLVAEGSGTGYNQQVLELGEIGDDRTGNAIDEVVLLSVIDQVHERQYHHGQLLGRRFGYR